MEYLPSICAVIVNYNGAKYQNDCIESLYSMKYPRMTILVVDSGSQDDSINMLKNKYPKVIIIECKTNVGVAKGNNIGIKYSIDNKYEYTLLINNDVEVDKNLIYELLESTSSADVIVPKIFYYEPRNIIWYAGGKLVWNRGSAVHFGIHELDRGQFEVTQDVEYAPTCCMLIKNTVFNKVGFMDEEYFMYYDDTDFCARLNQHGIKIRYNPKACMWHKVSSSSGGESSKITVYYSYRNQLKYINKFKTNMKAIGYLYVYARAVIKCVIGVLKQSNDKYIFKSYVDYYNKSMGRCDDL